MLEIIKVIHAENSKLTFILGDYNLNLLKYRSNNSVGEYLDNMVSHSFFPTIRNPTRIIETTATLIDNIFTNCIRNNFSTAILCSDISDHFPVTVRIELKVVKIKLCNFQTSRSFDPISIDTFKIRLM